MKKNPYCTHRVQLHCYLKIFMIAKCILILVIVSSFQAFSKGYSQSKINISIKNASIKKALKEIEKNSDYRFLYNDDVMTGHEISTFSLTNASIDDAMHTLLLNTSLDYQLTDNNLVIITPKGTDVKATAISGTVTDDNNEPLPGVSIRIKGTSTGTQTDVNGKFKLTIQGSGNEVLLVSYIGYAPQEIAVSGKTVFTIKLKSNAIQLNEVVAIGFATVKRRDLTGSVSSVDAKQLKDVPINSAAEALAGRLAGVQVTQSEGSPDADVRIRVRGGGSVTQDNSPLYIIDGVQVENGLASISPQDIQSIDVLKDASSTAIYGARGANGVVIVTTKGGREQKTTVTYNGFVGVSKLAKELSVLDPYNFVLYQYERSRGNATDSTNFVGIYGHTFDTLSVYKNAQPVDWQKLALGQNAFQQTHNVSIAGGTKTTTFNVSFSDNQQQGTVIGTSLDRKLISFRFDHNVNDNLRVGFNVRYNNSTTMGAGVSSPSTSSTTGSTAGSSYNNLRNSVKYQPFLLPNQSETAFDQAYFTETNAAGNNLGVLNPIVLAGAQYRKTVTNITDINGYLNYSFNKYLSFKSTLGFDMNNAIQNAFDDYITPNALINGGGQPIAGINNNTTKTLDISNVVNYSNTASNPKHNEIALLLGNEFYNTNITGLTTIMKSFPIGISADNALNQLEIGVPVTGYPLPVYSNSGLASFFGRANYTLDKKYLATFTYRADGSSKFSPGNQWGYFPSGALAWRISDESFMKSVPVISDMKLRVSYGASGNNRIPDYQNQTVYNATAVYYLNNIAQVGLATPYLKNDSLKWETTYSKNIGIDVGLFNNRIQFSVDAYRNNTKNLLINVPIPTTAGVPVQSGSTVPTQLRNVGETLNQGFETQITATILQKKGFTWTANFNVAYNSNKVLSLANGQDHYFANSGWGVSGQPSDFIVQVGQPVGSVYGYVADGYYTTNDFNYNPTTTQYTLKPGVVDPSKVIGTPMPGMIKFKVLSANPTLNANGNPVLSTADQTIIGNTTPQITGGLNQQFTYKNFDLSVFINFQARAQVLNANKIEFTNGYTAGTNLLGIEANRWHTIDPSTGAVVEKIVTISGTPVAVGVSPDQLNAINANAQVPIPVTGSAAFYPNSSAVEDASFIRINNVTFGYSFSSKLLQRVSISKLRIYATGSNLGIITGYSGYDPEVNTRRATPVTPGVDYSAYPRSRTYLFGVNLTL